jgi:hypothetical protein
MRLSRHDYSHADLDGFIANPAHAYLHIAPLTVILIAVSPTQSLQTLRHAGCFVDLIAEIIWRMFLKKSYVQIRIETMQDEG